ncbi:hypothetical protein DO72_4493 [Burkholderia pseudomallei]|nr:hypothetical protein DO72_4493 [Burkholderia pseudomallei]
MPSIPSRFPRVAGCGNWITSASDVCRVTPLRKIIGRQVHIAFHHPHHFPAARFPAHFPTRSHRAHTDVGVANISTSIPQAP